MNELTFIPDNMQPWGLGLVEAPITEYGRYILVGCEQAGKELHHEVVVLDENELPLTGVWVIFGYGSGPSINLTTRRNVWSTAPAVLKGNAQKTLIGTAQHTFQAGGEDIWLWDLDVNNDLLLPSPIVRSCNWVGTPIGAFIHTGVRLTFQRQRSNVISMEDRIRALESSVQSQKPLRK